MSVFLSTLLAQSLSCIFRFVYLSSRRFRRLFRAMLKTKYSDILDYKLTVIIFLETVAASRAGEIGLFTLMQIIKLTCSIRTFAIIKTLLMWISKVNCLAREHHWFKTSKIWTSQVISSIQENFTSSVIRALDRYLLFYSARWTDRSSVQTTHIRQSEVSTIIHSWIHCVLLVYDPEILFLKTLRSHRTWLGPGTLTTEDNSVYSSSD